MKTFCKYLIIAVTGITLGCKPQKIQNTQQKGEGNEAIISAIHDFSMSSSLFRQGSVFFVWLEDHSDIYSVSIGSPAVKVLYDKSLGTSGFRLPSHVLVVDDRLFYWWEDGVEPSSNVIDMLKKYEILQDNQGGAILFPDKFDHVMKKSMHYYFCKNNISNFRSVKTTKALGYYNAPILKCQ